MTIEDMLNEMNKLEIEVSNRRALLDLTEECSNLKQAEHELWMFQKKHFGIAKNDRIDVGTLIKAITKVLELKQ